MSYICFLVGHTVSIYTTWQVGIHSKPTDWKVKTSNLVLVNILGNQVWWPYHESLLFLSFCQVKSTTLEACNVNFASSGESM